MTLPRLLSVPGVVVHDRTAHSPGAQRRPVRERIRSLVLHRIGNAAADPPPWREGRTANSLIAFFLTDVDGVATTTLAGNYETKVSTIRQWQRDGIPPESAAASFVPYHFVVEPDGNVHQMLGLERVGAHAVGHNQVGVGVALVGDFRTEQAPDRQMEAAVRVAGAVVRLCGGIRQVTLHSHDEVRNPPKGCPGALFPLQDVKRMIRGAAENPAWCWAT